MCLGLILFSLGSFLGKNINFKLNYLILLSFREVCTVNMEKPAAEITFNIAIVEIIFYKTTLVDKKNLYKDEKT